MTYTHLPPHPTPSSSRLIHLNNQNRKNDNNSHERGTEHTPDNTVAPSPFHLVRRPLRDFFFAFAFADYYHRRGRRSGSGSSSDFSSGGGGSGGSGDISQFDILQAHGAECGACGAVVGGFGLLGGFDAVVVGMGFRSGRGCSEAVGLVVG